MAIIPPGPNDPKHAPEVIAAAIATEHCHICNAKPGEVCTSVINAENTREVPHAARIAAANEQP